MAVLVSAHQLSKSFGARPLFKDLTFAIDSGERIGLIGPNGAGKSTLLKILASRIRPDEGALSFQRGLKVGFLEQDPGFSEQATVLSTVMEGADGDWDRLGEAQELISRLELDSFGGDAVMEKLSGGWRKRVALARELIRSPDLLLLDEPTNHLDVQSILWLEEFLAKARFATLTITHDRLFLQRIANRILELDPRHPGGLLSVQGDYATYVEIREQQIAAQERREIVLKNTLRRETEWLRQGAKARTTKQQARIQRAEQLKDEVEDVTYRNQARTAKLDFQGAEKSPKKLIAAKDVSKRYGERTIFRGLELMLTPGARIGLLGPNGAGKSTLIRVLLGQEEPTSGTVTRSDFLQVSYFDQARETLDPELTVVKTLCPSGEFVEYRGNRIHIRSYLDRFLFSQSQMDMRVGRLSGGEQSRILLARLMLKPANLLVLDEPTNDLDIATLSVLEECLTEFQGALLLVTHDRYFLDQVCNRILAFSPGEGDGTLVSFADLSQWENWHESREALKKERAKVKPASQDDAREMPSPRKKRKLGFKEQRELDSMEANIQAAEEKLATLTTESQLSENVSNSAVIARVSQEMAEIQAEIDRLYARWAELEG